VTVEIVAVATEAVAVDEDDDDNEEQEVVIVDEDDEKVDEKEGGVSGSDDDVGDDDGDAATPAAAVHAEVSASDVAPVDRLVGRPLRRDMWRSCGGVRDRRS
jgi:hypothetical protein